MKKLQRPIVSSDLKKNLAGDEIDYNFFKSYNPLSIKALLEAAVYLNFKGLHELCITFIATQLYVDVDNIKR
jgi:hypothetical protein